VQAPIKVFGVEGRYAHALFSAASQKNAIEAVEKELTDFQRLADEKRELVDFIENPVLSKDRKLSALTDILKSRKASDLTINLFGALTENNRLSRAMGVIKAYCTIMSAYRGEVPCTVTSAKPLDAKTQKELETVLKGFLEPKQVLKLDTKTDSSIIGGMVVEVGDKYIDMSTATKVKKIMQSLKETV
jgi:F-type H+-transporting ATPase subunit O